MNTAIKANDANALWTVHSLQCFTAADQSKRSSGRVTLAQPSMNVKYAKEKASFVW